MSFNNLSPDVPMALTKLQVMSKEDLHQMFNDESMFDEYIKSLDQMKQLYSEKEMLLASNKSLAEYNLSQEPILQQKREALTEKHREAIELMAKLKETKETIEQKSGKVKPDFLYSLLQVAHSEAERESDQLMEDLVDGKIQNIDEFLESFMEKRKIYHLRKVKLDKMKEILEGRNKQITPVRAAPRPPPVPQLNRAPAPYQMAGGPYPLGGVSAAPPNNWGSAPSLAYPQPNNLPYPVYPMNR